jgi:hypothetical protein
MLSEDVMNASSIRISFRKPVVAAACLALIGCGTDPVNIGDGDEELDKSSLSSYAAVWDGYVEAYEFASGSDRVRVTIDPSGTGYLQLGEGDLLALPTDPAVGWPPTAPAYATDFFELNEGVRYPLGNVRVESERIRFEFDTHSAYAPFCELQTPVEVAGSPGFYWCFGVSGDRPTADGGCEIFGASGSPERVDCRKLFICRSACDCDASACTSRPGYDTPLDAALDDTGDSLVGTIVFQEDDGGAARTIRLQRQ